MRTRSLIVTAALLGLAGEPALAQTTERTIDEIKTETLVRAQTGAYPAPQRQDGRAVRYARRA